MYKIEKTCKLSINSLSINNYDLFIKNTNIYQKLFDNVMDSIIFSFNFYDYEYIIPIN